MDETPKPKTSSKRGKPGVSRQQWLALSLETFESEGVAAIRVEELARKLGVNKSGFYFHFRDKNDLLRAMLHYWENLEHVPIEDLVEITAENAASILRGIVQAVDNNDLSRFDAAIRQWAKYDPEVSGIYQAKLDLRFHVVRTCFQKLGFSGLEMEMRARTFVVYVSCEREFFPDFAAENRRQMQELRLALLAGLSTATPSH